LGQATFVPNPLVLYRQHAQNVTGNTNRRKGLLERIRSNVGHLRNRAHPLGQQLDFVAAFYEMYQSDFDTANENTFESFLSLRHAGYLRAKLAGILARKYRFLKLN
jgi:hypothetical protein